MLNSEKEPAGATTLLLTPFHVLLAFPRYWALALSFKTSSIATDWLDWLRGQRAYDTTTISGGKKKGRSRLYILLEPIVVVSAIYSLYTCNGQ